MEREGCPFGPSFEAFAPGASPQSDGIPSRRLEKSPFTSRSIGLVGSAEADEIMKESPVNAMAMSLMDLSSLKKILA
jgi:hypothetical protein